MKKTTIISVITLQLAALLLFATTTVTAKGQDSEQVSLNEATTTAQTGKNTYQEQENSKKINPEKCQTALDDNKQLYYSMYFSKLPNATEVTRINVDFAKYCGADPNTEQRVEMRHYIAAISWLHGQKVHGSGKDCYKMFVKFKDE